MILWFYNLIIWHQSTSGIYSFARKWQKTVLSPGMPIAWDSQRYFFLVCQEQEPHLFGFQPWGLLDTKEAVSFTENSWAFNLWESQPCSAFWGCRANLLPLPGHPNKVFLWAHAGAVCLVPYIVFLGIVPKAAVRVIFKQHVSTILFC